MKKIFQSILITSLTTLILACGSSQPNTTQQAPGFLPNYSLLKQIPSPKGTTLYVYKNPSINRADYTAVIVEPTSLYMTNTKDKTNVTDQQIEKGRGELDKGITQIVSQKLKLATEAGPGVLRLQVAITGASLETDGFKPWNIIPISAAIKLASMASGNDKKPVLVVELKFTDSQTGVLLKEVVTTISGEKLSSESNISSAFDKLATSWVQEALKYSNKS